jgi:hypothetical protein
MAVMGVAQAKDALLAVIDASAFTNGVGVGFVGSEEALLVVSNALPKANAGMLLSFLVGDGVSQVASPDGVAYCRVESEEELCRIWAPSLPQGKKRWFRRS